MTYSWTQPICRACYLIRHPDLQPAAMVEAVREPESCVDCGLNTIDGIYYRVDPKTAKFPSLRKDDA